MSRHVTTTLRTERLRDTSQHGTHPPRPRLVRSGGHGHRVLTSPNANSCGEGGLAWPFDRCTRARRRWGRHRARQGTVDRGPEGKVLRVVANQDPIRPRCRTCGPGLRRRPSRWILRGRKCPMGAMLEWLGRQGLPHSAVALRTRRSPPIGPLVWPTPPPRLRWVETPSDVWRESGTRVRSSRQRDERQSSNRTIASRGHVQTNQLERPVRALPASRGQSAKSDQASLSQLRT